MAQPSISVAKKPWKSLMDFGLSLRRTSAKFGNLRTVVPFILTLYALCIGVGFIIWMLLLLLDAVAGNSFLSHVANLPEAAQFVLPSLQFINGGLGLFVGFSVLTHSSPRACFLRIKGNCLCRWKIRGLPKVKYGSLMAAEKRENCCICLEGIDSEESVRILPKCKHYFHGRCIDRWLLCQNKCPVCRAAVCPL
ncbi:hypothetical protein SUGI_0814810 [Cryptomeria japonica]|nr:hypothetical protein SUGI_0814810 [Cryptomeria japonica]